jgi:outer membrane protein assembly complex protein YaeT
MRVRRWLPAAAVLLTLLGGAACHEDSGVAVKSLNFDGNTAFDDARLKAILATRQSGWLPWSTKHYFDRAEFDADARRLIAFYTDHGYPHARIAGIDVQFNDKKDAVNLTIRIEEGAPLVVESVQFFGFEGLPDAAMASLRDGAVATGQPRDADRIGATRDLAARLFRDNGYPYASVQVNDRRIGETDRVVVNVQAQPGPLSYFGEVGIAGLKSVGEHVVTRELTFHRGDLYRESEITKSQQRLLELGLFSFAHIAAATTLPAGGQVPMRVTVTEALPRALRLSGGYGSEEHFRGSAQWSHLNFLGGARHADVEAKYSGIDRGTRFTFVEPYLLRRGFSFSLSGTAWHTNQLTYETGTYGGRASVAYHSDTGVTGIREPVHYEVQVGYVNEYLRYGITEESLDDLSRRLERIALGLDPDTGRGAGTLSAVDFDFERVAVDDAMNPHRGTIASLHVEQAVRLARGSYNFREVLAETRGYLPFGKSVVWANRARAGKLFAQNIDDMPFASRYFSGGSNSVRGWGRFEISPLNSDGLPVGGRSLLELSSELRFPIRGKLTGVAFVDAGAVRSDVSEIQGNDLRYAVGPGLRYLTPIGPVRVDVGYQLNPVPGLIINGAEQTREWRIHFSIGQAF